MLDPKKYKSLKQIIKRKKESMSAGTCKLQTQAYRYGETQISFAQKNVHDLKTDDELFDLSVAKILLKEQKPIGFPLKVLDCEIILFQIFYSNCNSFMVLRQGSLNSKVTAHHRLMANCTQFASSDPVKKRPNARVLHNIHNKEYHVCKICFVSFQYIISRVRAL